MNSQATRSLSFCVQRHQRPIRYFITLLMVLALGACATNGTSKNAIEDRAQARWDAILSNDLDTAYGYYSPGYRTATSRVDFEIAMRLRKIKWVSADVLESSCEADLCTITTLVGYEITKPLPGVPEWKSKQEVTERWVRTEGQWWYVPEV